MVNNPNTGRASLLGIAGGYLVYLAYELLKNMIDDVPTTMPRFVQILFFVLFAGIGIALIVYAWIVWKKGREDTDKNPVELEDQDNSENGEENTPKE